MGGGVSTGNESSPQASIEASSMVDQGHTLGPEFDVILISPHLQGLQAKERYLLRIAYEALVVLDIQTGDALSYFKYQDIVCWGCGANVFQFKVFGAVFNRQSRDNDVSDVVPILFQTKHGREIEAITLSSVRMLMKDMEGKAVSKADFVRLKSLLTAPNHTDGIEKGWFDTVQKFAAMRRFTSHQGQELVKIAKLEPSIDGFELMEIAVFLWNSVLNRDSFQLILNVFDDPSERENLIERIRLESPKDPSAQLLKLECPDAGGGLSPTASIEPSGSVSQPST